MLMHSAASFVLLHCHWHQVSDISFAGKLKIRLGPLVDVIPGFAAAMVTFARPPRMKYHMDFGALGGSYAASKDVYALVIMYNLLHCMHA